MTDYLTMDDLLAVAEPVLGRRPEVRDWGLLESALARPAASVFGQDAYPTLDSKAAALLISLARNHALVDGNKRLAWEATRLFYGLNGAELRAPEDEAYDLVLAVATGAVAEVGKVAERLGRWRSA